MNRPTVVKGIIVVAVVALLLIGYNLMKGKPAAVAPTNPAS